MRTLFKLVALISAARAAAGTCGWNYATNGADWPQAKLHDCGNALKTQVNQCAGTHQAPIDLKTTWMQKSAGFDNYNRLYTNQKVDVKVDWNGITSQTAVNAAGTDLQTFQSYHGQKSYGAPLRFTGVQFHFHSPSEHTVDGQSYDIEMHTVHLPTASENGVIAAAVGILFDTKLYTRTAEPWETKTIDNFFDNLKWHHREDNNNKNSALKTPLVEEVTYGDLMMMVDTENRYTYRGSVTTPPCAETVYWNVVRTVYQISQTHLDQFKAQLARGDGSYGRGDNLESYGNNRVIIPETFSHQPFIISNGNDLTKPTRAAILPEPTTSMGQSASGSYQAPPVTVTITNQTPAKATSESTETPETTPKADDASQYLLVVTILLIVAIVFLLFAVVIVVKNSFDSKRTYNDVPSSGALATDRQNEGGESELAEQY